MAKKVRVPPKNIPEGMTPEQAEVLQKASPMVNRQVGGDFSRVDSPERRTALLRAAPHARQSSTLWTKDRRLLKRFFVRRHLEYIDQFECEFAGRASRVLGEVDRELDLAGANEIYFNLRCEESSLFFHLPRREISSRGGMLLLKIPREIYEIQRRAQLRYRSTELDGFKIHSEVLALWLEDMTVLDVSAGGIGVLIRFPTEESAAQFRLRQDERIHFHLDLGVFSFIANGEVRYIKRETDSATGALSARIGIRFVGLSQDTVETLLLFAMERSYARLRAMFKDE